METINLPPITRAKLILTNKCQLKCKYCYETPGDSIMPISIAKNAIDMILMNARESNRVPEVSFFGGEPLIVYEGLMIPLIEYIREEKGCDCPISFTTNGILLDEDKLKYLRSKNVQFMLSIDGCKTSHDSNRVYKNNRGSFNSIEKNIENILKYFPNTRARMTLTPTNAPYLYESVRYIADRGFLDMHIIPDLHVLNQWKSGDFDIIHEQLKLLESYIIDKFEEGEIPLVFRTLADMFPRLVLDDYCRSSNSYRKASCCDPTHRCGIGVLDNAIIDVDGSIYACQHGGDINKDSIFYLGDINSGVIESNRLRLLEMNRGPLHSKSLDCNSCPLDYICTGGCVPNNYAINADFSVVPEAYCLWTRELYESALRIIKHFDEEQDNLLFKDYFYGIVKRGVSCVC